MANCKVQKCTWKAGLVLNANFTLKGFPPSILNLPFEQRHAKAGRFSRNLNELLSFRLLQQKCRSATSLEHLLPVQLVRRTRQSRNTSSFFSMVVTSLSCWSFLCTRVLTRHGAGGGAVLLLLPLLLPSLSCHSNIWHTATQVSSENCKPACTKSCCQLWCLMWCLIRAVMLSYFSYCNLNLKI